MAEGGGSVLKHLVELSRLDVLLAGIALERKKLQTKLAESEASLKRAAVVLQTKQRALEDRRHKYQSAERALKDERQKLVDRRKALTTLSNYKLQQAAEREIAVANEALSGQETVIIRMLEELDSMGADVAAVEAGFKGEFAAFETLKADAAATVTTFAEREREYSAMRHEIATATESGALSQYTRIKDRFPMGAVAKVEQGMCAGCFMQVGPQVIVQIARGNGVTRCPGCGRILYQDELPAKDASV
jgi:predicted  nucleic acid-binding Zn-ribbon protein